MRTGLLTLLLVLTLGTGAAAQSPRPAAAASYAPDDLVSAIPGRIASLDLFVRVRSGDAALGSGPEDRAYWLDFLVSRGKEAADMVVAYGVSTESLSDPGLKVWAFRIAGLAANELIEPSLVTSGTDLADIPLGAHADWRDFDGRQVLVLSADGVADWRAYYPRGEVLFIVYGDDRMAVEDVIPVLAPELKAAPSPAPTALLYAPEDLALALPSRVGDYEVRISTGALPNDDRGVYRDMLLPFDKSPDEVRVADGMGYPAGDEEALDRDGPSFDLWAMRVEGLAADALVIPWVYGAFAAAEDFDGSLWEVGWREIDGREVYAATLIPELSEEAVARLGANPEFGWYVLAKGEVLYVVSLPLTHPSGGPSLAEILAGLPWSVGVGVRRS